MTALHRTLALAVVHDVSVLVRHDLDLDVARLGDALIAKGALRLGARHVERLEQAALFVHDANALTTTTTGGLEHDRVAELLGTGNEALLVNVFLQPGHQRHACLQCDVAGSNLVAHCTDRRRPRAEERDASRLTRLGELGVLTEEAVAGMQRIAAGLLGHLEHALGVEIALGGLATTNVLGARRFANVQGRAIGVGIDGNRFDAHLVGGADHA